MKSKIPSTGTAKSGTGRPPNSSNRQDRERAALKKVFVASLVRFGTHAGNLRVAIMHLRTAGVGRKTIGQWAAEAGFTDRYIRTLLSEMFIEAGLRIRKAGAGPKTSQEALFLLKIARNHFGAKAGRFLRAAARADEKQRHTGEQSRTLFGNNPIPLISYTDKEPVVLPSIATNHEQ